MLQSNTENFHAANPALEFPVTPPLSLSPSYERKRTKALLSYDPKPWLYVSIFGAWLLSLVWFQPRLWELLEASYSTSSWWALFTFILFIDFAWLYGFYNVGVVAFALIHKYFSKKPEQALTKTTLLEYPAVALLYTTYNDFFGGKRTLMCQPGLP